MPVAFAILAIVCCFICGWGYVMARNPKEWRLWWMNLVGYLDLNSTREQRRRQEMHIKMSSYGMSVLSLTLAASCTFWVMAESGERSAKGPGEKGHETTIKQLEKMRGKFRKLRG